MQFAAFIWGMILVFLFWFHGEWLRVRDNYLIAWAAKRFSGDSFIFCAPIYYPSTQKKKLIPFIHNASYKDPFQNSPRKIINSNLPSYWHLKLYCRYLYTRPCMINHIWSLKQLWLQVNGHAWFHLQRLRWPVRNGEGAKNSKWKYMSPAGFEPTPCLSTTGKLQRLRPLGHEGLMVISG